MRDTAFTGPWANLVDYVLGVHVIRVWIVIPSWDSSTGNSNLGGPNLLLFAKSDSMKTTKKMSNPRACCNEAYTQPSVCAGFAVLGWTVGFNTMTGRPIEAIGAVLVFAVVFAVIYFMQKKR